MYQKQDFYQLREKCLSEQKLFEDEYFQPSDKILSNYDEFVWLRPHEIVKNPEFHVEGFSRFDVTQGAIGNCWFLAAVASLTQDEKLFFNVVCDDNSSFDENYAGIFHFRFWLYGNWVDIVIDDRLPTVNKKLAFMRSSENNEFWPALLEKAYAKFYGSYEFLKGGNTSEALEDFTGGVAEIFYLKNNIPNNFFKLLEKSFEKNSLICCSMDAREGELEELTPQGLVKGHAYSITKVKMIDIKTPKRSGKIELIRMRNPWGNEIEWKGNFSDKSRAWQLIPQSEKEAIDLKFDADGEFWMTYKDFIENFHTVEICNLLKSFTHLNEFEFEETKNWHLKKAEGEWEIGVNAGGCGKFSESFYTNPKFLLTLTDTEKCSIIVALMQKNRRRLGLPHLSIGFVIYEISDNFEFDPSFFASTPSVARTLTYINTRESTLRCDLNPGKYLIMPTTFDPNEEGEFLLRVISESSCELEKILEHSS